MHISVFACVSNDHTAKFISLRDSFFRLYSCFFLSFSLCLFTTLSLCFVHCVGACHAYDSIHVTFMPICIAHLIWLRCCLYSHSCGVSFHIFRCCSRANATLARSPAISNVYYMGKNCETQTDWIQLISNSMTFDVFITFTNCLNCSLIVRVCVLIQWKIKNDPELLLMYF